MSDVTVRDEAAVADYERGSVSVREVVRSVLLRFAPASAFSLLGVVAATVTPGNPLGPLMTVMGGWVGWIGLGFGMGILGMRRWLYPDAKITGLRSVLAGVLGGLAPLALLRFGIGLSFGPLTVNTVLVLVGVLMALAMFFPWLTPTPPHMRDDPQVDEAESHLRISGSAP